MELRRLDKSEHSKTRNLWECVFDEDSKEFLDYYYFFKTRDNEIYVIEEDEDVRSMLHLNPYTIQVGEEQFIGHYIIAVATESAYRRRGYMGKILKKSMQDMYSRKELFTFLMPAAESIYTPYDFRFVYDQNVWTYTIEDEQIALEKPESELAENPFTRARIKGLGNKEAACVVSDAGIGDGKLLAEFFNTYFAEKFQVYAVRDEGYYQIMLFEQQSENGGIRLLEKDSKVVGTFLYSDEDGLEIREPLYLKEYEMDFWNAVRSLCTERGQSCAAVYADIDKSNEGVKSTIMVRIIHLENLLKAIKAKEGEEIDCSFAVLDSILPQNSRVWKLKSKALEFTQMQEQEEGTEVVTAEDLLVRETEDSEGVLTIAALTSLLFGYKSVEEVAEEPDVYLTEHLVEELRKIQTLNAVYLNEIV
ncbi:GNAT family N-acetyltransferase [Mediterraneibacter agrestimuris]|uniref:GNAT family N-acetyltransferase n=1 Tax=Mediterraneibacter agrestimuris TaxID=2941333 RepID=UPI00203F05F8|nr:GNAT family N-acetyltransferase [Mediterraneibacter agrestimuris]